MDVALLLLLMLLQLNKRRHSMATTFSKEENTHTHKLGGRWGLGRRGGVKFVFSLYSSTLADDRYGDR